MALKPTIYKMKLALTDLDREVYENLSLTVACHPSETLERMMVRVLAYCLNAREGLELCKGLSDTEEADLWAHSLDGSLALWIDVGEPTIERLKKSLVSRQRFVCIASIPSRRHGGNCRLPTLLNYPSAFFALIGRVCKRSQRRLSGRWSSR